MFSITKQTAMQSLREVGERRLPCGFRSIALDSAMRILPMDKSMLAHLETLGFRRAVLPRANYP